MNTLAFLSHVSDDKILGVVGALLPLWMGCALILWIFRLIRSLRDRLDRIEDKLELLVLAQEIKLSKSKTAHEVADQEIPSKT